MGTAQQPPAAEDQPPAIDGWEISGGLGGFTGQPFVMVRWGDKSAQITPGEAQDLGVSLISMGQAAILDASAFEEMMQGPLQAEAGTAVAFLQSLRCRRGQHAAENPAGDINSGDRNGHGY